MNQHSHQKAAKKTKLVVAALTVLLLIVLGICFSWRGVVMRVFLYEFQNASDDDKEGVAMNFSHALTFDEMLSSIETGYRVCHAPAHQLGKAIYAATNNISTSLSICQNRCGGGCFHGVFIKMFSSDGPMPTTRMNSATSSAPLTKIALDATAQCKTDTVRNQVTPWRCIHGVGHVLLFTARYDLPKALDACSLTGPTLAPSCRSGAFMEFQLNKKFESKIKSSVMYPCDVYPEWECFFNRTNLMLKTNGMESSLAACRELSKQQGLACIRGLGAALFYYRPDIVKSDGQIEKSCGLSDKDEEVACEDGVISRFSTIIDDKEDQSCDVAAPSYRVLCAAKLRKIRSFTF